jgi:hypothetical protein
MLTPIWCNVSALQGHAQHVAAMAFSRGGGTLASGGEDGQVRL